MLKKILFFILLLGIVIRPSQIVLKNSSDFFGKGYMERYTQFQKLYESSQYVKKNNPGIIPDETLESFAAGAFLKGTNPILIIHDQPPLGRYILALSIALFDNTNTILFFLLALSLVGTFLISYNLTQNKVYALFPVLLFANEPLFLNKFVYTPLLEPVQLPFIIFALYFFIKSLQTKTYTRWYLATGLMLGLVISIRFFALGLVLFGIMGLFLLIKRDWKRLFVFVATSPLTIVVLIASYFRTIQSGYSPIKIIGIQKYMLIYHKSQLTLPFSFWDLLLFNRWHTWWGEKAIAHDSQWNIFWPLAIIVVAVYFFFFIAKKVKYTQGEVVVLMWILGYSLFLSTGNTSTRYFLPLTPFLYIIAVSHIKKLMALKRSKK